MRRVSSRPRLGSSWSSRHRKRSSARQRQRPRGLPLSQWKGLVYMHKLLSPKICHAPFRCSSGAWRHRKGACGIREVDAGREELAGERRPKRRRSGESADQCLDRWKRLRTDSNFRGSTVTELSEVQPGTVAEIGEVAGSQKRMRNKRLGEELVIRLVSVQDED